MATGEGGWPPGDRPWQAVPTAARQGENCGDQRQGLLAGVPATIGPNQVQLTAVSRAKPSGFRRTILAWGSSSKHRQKAYR
jgi:hypothetical protein